MENEKIPYRIIVGKGPEQAFYARAEQIKKAKIKYDESSSLLAKFVEFKGDELSMIRAESLEQANLVLEILGLPQAFPTLEPLT